jgi:hypothetical protein
MRHARIGRALSRIVFLALLATSSLAAQDASRVNPQPASAAAYRNRLLGAFDEQSGEPIEGLEVIDLASGTTARTTKTGTVSLAFLTDGTSLVRLRKLGYAPMTMSVAISPADTSPLTIVMKRSAQELPAVVTKDSASPYISPALRGFDERMRAHLGGQFVAESSLRKMDSDVLSDVLRRFHGATLVRGGHFVSTRKSKPGPVLRSVTPGLNCYVAVYENGIKRASLGPIDFDKVNVSDYAGVEFYAGPETYPAWISPTDNDCGVLLLWLREK